jgi:hypothetical protein
METRLRHSHSKIFWLSQSNHLPTSISFTNLEQLNSWRDTLSICSLSTWSHHNRS